MKHKNILLATIAIAICGLFTSHGGGGEVAKNSAKPKPSVTIHCYNLTSSTVVIEQMPLKQFLGNVEPRRTSGTSYDIVAPMGATIRATKAAKGTPFGQTQVPLIKPECTCYIMDSNGRSGPNLLMILY